MKTIETGLLGMADFEKVAMVAVCAREHVLFVGKPGLAKTLAVERFKLHLEGQFFSAQMSKFSDESVLFGLPDMKEMRESGEIVYPDRGLATCHWLHLDEIFDGSDVLLRTTLSTLEERKILRGKETKHIPLVSCFATANYVRRNEIVDAVIDRFALSIVAHVPSDHQRKQLYSAANTFEALEAPKKLWTLDELGEIYERSKKVTIPDFLVDALLDWAKEQGFSPRRERKMAKILRVSAALHGRDEINDEDVDLLQFLIPLSPSVIEGSLDNKKSITKLKDAIKTYLNESTQMAELAKLEKVSGEGLEALKEIKQHVDKLRLISGVSTRVEERRAEAVRKLTEMHAKIVNKMGVEL